MCSGSEAGSYLRLIGFVYHSTLGLRVIKKKKKVSPETSVFLVRIRGEYDKMFDVLQWNLMGTCRYSP